MVQKSIVEWFSADKKRTTFFYNEYGLVFRNFNVKFVLFSWY